MNHVRRRGPAGGDVSYLLFRFFQDFALIYPVYLILFQQTGLDYTQIAQLLVIWAAAMMVLEIPSGVLADLWSKRGTIFLALMLKATGFLVWLLRPDFGGFALGFVFWGFQEALCSGTTDALLFDSLKTSGREADFEAIAGLGALCARVAIGFSLILGGWVFSHSPGLAMVSSAVSMVISAICALFLKEPGHSRGAAAAGPRRLLGEIGGALRGAAIIPGLAALVLFGGLTTAVYGVLDEFDFLFGTVHGVPIAWIGAWGLVRFGFEGTGGWLAPRVSRWFGKEALRKLVWWIAAAGALLTTGTILGLRGLLPFYFLFYGMMATAEVLYQGHIQRNIESAGRATVSSVISFVYTALGMGIILLFGWIADSFSLPMIFPAGGVLIMVTAAVYLIAGAGVARTTRPPAD